MNRRLLIWTGVLWLAGHSLGLAQELKEIASFPTGPRRNTLPALSPDGNTFAAWCGGFSGENPVTELKLWDVATGKQTASIPVKSDCLNLTFSADGKLLASNNHGADSKLTVWDLAAKKPRATYTDTLICDRIVFSSNGQQIAAAGALGVELRDLANGTVLSSFNHTVLVFRALAFTRDLKMLAASNYQEIELWDVRTGKLRTILSEQRGTVERLTFTQDEKTLVAASYWSKKRRGSTTQIKLWDLASGKDRATLPEQAGEIRDIRVSPDGKILALVLWQDASDDDELKLLEIASGRTWSLGNAPHNLFDPMLFTPDGRLLVGRPTDDVMKLYRVSLPK